MKRTLLLCTLLSCLLATAQVTLTSSNLPIIVINTNGGVAVPDTPKIIANMRIINNAPGLRNFVTDSANEYSGNIGIELRGQTSQGFPQKPYSIELRDSTAINNNNTPLFGLPSESDWILYAPYNDKTLMRNFLAFETSLAMGHWASHSRYAELILNGDYQGIYVLEEKIKRDNGRVNIKKLDAGDSTGNAVTGGYIFSIDKDSDAWFSAYTTPGSNKPVHFTYVYPELESIIPQQQDYIKNYVDSFENVLAGASFQDTVTGFRKYADEQSFIDYFIINELSHNVDGYRISAFFHKNRNSVNPKIIAGPVWDYNIAFRNANYCSGSNYQTWAYQFNNVCSTDDHQVPFWWSRLLQDTTYAKNMGCRWQQLRTDLLSISRINAAIDSIATLVDEARVRHFIQWPILGQYVWPNPTPIPTTYAGEIATLKTWIANRINWLDTHMPQSTNCFSALTVSLLNIAVVKRNEVPVVYWQTVAENNTAHFVVERSYDGKNFLQAGIVEAAGNSDIKRNYQYADAGIDRSFASRIFYRIRSVDKNGGTAISKVVSLNLLEALPDVQVNPNPFAAQLSVTITSAHAQAIQLSIMNAEGRAILSERKKINEGSTTLQYNTSAWSKGAYLIKVTTEDGSTQALKVVK